MKNIIGIGDGAKQCQYTREPFWVINSNDCNSQYNKIKLIRLAKINKCNNCGKEIPKGWRYCNGCQKKNRLESQRKWRRSKRFNGR